MSYPKLVMPQPAITKAAIKAVLHGDGYQRKLAAYLEDPQAFLSAFRVFPGSTIDSWSPPWNGDPEDTFMCVASSTVVIMEGVAGKSALDQKAFMVRHLKDIDDKYEFCCGIPPPTDARATYAVATDRCVTAGANASDIARMVMLFVEREKIRCYGV